MTDYTQNTTFTTKDALPADDPDKLILGADLDSEFSELQSASATKYDSGDIATQAQAEAGLSNSVLMTPLRVAQLIIDAGGSGAGIIGDLILLQDPGDDRIIYWDESQDAAAFLDIGTHLETTAGQVLNVTESTIDHDALTNFVANEHIDHSAVSALGGSGITVTGSDITADFTVALDITGLAAITVLEVDVDYVPVYDDSNAGNRKVLVDTLIGEKLGDGKWYRNTNQSMSAGVDLTVLFDTVSYDDLERGTFSTSTGQYTAGSAGARILYCVTIRIDTIKDDETLLLKVQIDGVDEITNTNYNAGNVFSSTDRTMTLTTAITLAASEVVRVRVNKNTSADAIVGGLINSSVSIVELG